MDYVAGVVRTREWPDPQMSSFRWMELPIWEFKPSELWMTQEGVKFKYLCQERLPYGNDPYPHVIIWQGKFYLEDGHHRLMRALLAGEKTLACRWLAV